MTRRVLGVDPGTAVTGYGVVEAGGRGSTLVECGVIRTRGSDPLWERIAHLHHGLTDVIARHDPDTMAVESVFYSRNVRTTVVLGHARGAILLAGAQADLRIEEFAPAVVKKTIVGTGRASKQQIGYMVQQLLKLRTPPTPHDAADGVAIALTALMRGPR